ncbi:MAG: RdgB/HAM1 family non-canonical purine NTP pyrophosphatase [Cyclobacteriaceae bacterium]|nr:RdgB/HAM1 family non-canonical purine NTP pyrophosphatase [Cyclobacteriaceae bacterium]
MGPVLGSSFLLKTLDEIGCYDELPETQQTLEGNAAQKAQYVFDRYHTVCFADDTGLEVDALNGEPGVYSARYAGLQRNSEDNIELLLKKLAGIKNRLAKFRTVIALAEPSGIKLFEGTVRGEILLERRGDKGFGYDPVFQPEGLSTSFAEMTLEQKNRVSHRARAVKKLIDYLLHNYGR